MMVSCQVRDWDGYCWVFLASVLKLRLHTCNNVAKSLCSSWMFMFNWSQAGSQFFADLGTLDTVLLENVSCNNAKFRTTFFSFLSLMKRRCESVRVYSFTPHTTDCCSLSSLGRQDDELLLCCWSADLNCKLWFLYMYYSHDLFHVLLSLLKNVWQYRNRPRKLLLTAN